jgi:hypothetical protein
MTDLLPFIAAVSPGQMPDETRPVPDTIEPTSKNQQQFTPK